MTEKHLSSQFDSELNSVSARVMELGGLVESQIRQAIHALSHFSLESVKQVAVMENRINAMEVEIDQDLSTIIARRQPTARDLRLLMAFSKATANLERMGDEASKMARMVQSIIESCFALAAHNGFARGGRPGFGIAAQGTGRVCPPRYHRGSRHPQRRRFD